MQYFRTKPIIAMLHLEGNSDVEIIERMIKKQKSTTETVLMQFL